jgi:hypothetical protein
LNPAFVPAALALKQHGGPLQYRYINIISVTSAPEQVSANPALSEEFASIGTCINTECSSLQCTTVQLTAFRTIIPRIS